MKGGNIVIKHFKNKRYWILMPPFLITTMLLFSILPYDKMYYSFFVVIAFWIIYYVWNSYAIKKDKRKKQASSENTE